MVTKKRNTKKRANSNSRPESSASGKVTQQASAHEKKAALSYDENRRALIAEMAYYKSEQRGFLPGDDLHDWFEAERKVDEMLGQR